MTPADPELCEVLVDPVLELEVVAPFEDALGEPPSPAVVPAMAVDEAVLALEVVTAVLAEGKPVDE